MALKDNKHRELYGDLNRVGKGSIEPEAYRKLQEAAATAKTHKS